MCVTGFVVTVVVSLLTAPPPPEIDHMITLVRQPEGQHKKHDSEAAPSTTLDMNVVKNENTSSTITVREKSDSFDEACSGQLPTMGASPQHQEPKTAPRFSNKGPEASRAAPAESAGNNVASV